MHIYFQKKCICGVATFSTEREYKLKNAHMLGISSRNFTWPHYTCIVINTDVKYHSTPWHPYRVCIPTQIHACLHQCRELFADSASLACKSFNLLFIQYFKFTVKRKTSAEVCRLSFLTSLFSHPRFVFFLIIARCLGFHRIWSITIPHQRDLHEIENINTLYWVMDHWMYFN